MLLSLYINNDKTAIVATQPYLVSCFSGHIHMEKEPLLPYSTITTTTRPPPLSLCPLPEDNEISIPPSSTTTLSSSLTPSELKDFLIFGPTSPTPSLKDPSPFSPLLDSLTLNINNLININSNTLNSPIASSSSADQQKSNLDQENPSLDHHQQAWLVDPNYPWNKNHLHRSRTAPALAVINDVDPSSSSVDDKPPQFSSQSIIRQGIVLLALYLSLGVVIYSCFRDHFTATDTHPVVDAFYFCIVTMCTIGYGDITPASTPTKLFSILFVLVGFGFIDILLTGMVSYVLDLQENYILRTIKGEGAHDPGRYIVDVKKGRMRIRMKVALALGVVVLCIGIGVAFMHIVERLDWVDSLYLSVMSVTTVGYGDRAFSSMTGRIFASIWLLVSTLAVARAFLYLAEARVDKRQRRIAKWALGRDMTVSQFLAADIDNNGFVSKSEFVIYKLKEMGKVSEKDIMLICKQFERLDTGNCGKITLADLMEVRH